MTVVGIGLLFSSLGKRSLVLSRKLNIYGDYVGGIDKIEVSGIVETGLFRYIRHPWYSGWFISSIGISLILCANFSGSKLHVFAIILTSAIPSISILCMVLASAMREEKFLLDYFKTDYLDYKIKVRSLFIPFII